MLIIIGLLGTALPILLIVLLAWDGRAKLRNEAIDEAAAGLRQYRRLGAKVHALRAEIEERARHRPT
jgi:hypothetical protein